MQFGQDKTLGVVYLTTMDRPDAALALALLHGYEGKREAREAAISIVGSGLGAATFCDIVARVYLGQGPLPNSNRTLPVGLAAEGALPADPAMVAPVLDRKNDKGEPIYPRGVRLVSDTSEVRAQIRNSMTGFVNGSVVVVLSAAATPLAQVLDLAGTRDLIAAKVRTLAIVTTDGKTPDAAAARRVLKDWPTPVVLIHQSIGSAARYPASSIDNDFSWAPVHPVVDAYRAFKQGAYDAPSWDLAALQYAIHPDSAFWRLSAPGALDVNGSGEFVFAEVPAGKHRIVTLAADQVDALRKVLVEIASAKPVPRQQRFRPPQASPPPPAPAKPEQKKQ